MKWDKLKNSVVGVYYRATLHGGNDLPLYAYVHSNGARWFNCCISPSSDDYMMEHPQRLEVAGARTLAAAKDNIATAARGYLYSLADALQVKRL